MIIGNIVADGSLSTSLIYSNDIVFTILGVSLLKQKFQPIFLGLFDSRYCILNVGSLHHIGF